MSILTWALAVVIVLASCATIVAVALIARSAVIALARDQRDADELEAEKLRQSAIASVERGNRVE